jgi:hypothetical protein
MNLRVESQAGFGGEQEPVAFWLGARRLLVRAITDRWFAPTQRWCKVDVDDDQTYVLRCQETTGQWDLAALTCRTGYPWLSERSQPLPAASDMWR